MVRRKETHLVRECLTVLKAAGHNVWRQNSGVMTKEYKGKRSFVRFNTMPGISDIMGFTNTGRIIACECKLKGNTLTEEQKAFLERVRRCNGIAIVAYSIDDVIAALNSAN